MASYVADNEKNEKEQQGPSSKELTIRITLTSTKTAGLEAFSKRLIDNANDKGIAVKGPMRMPTKNMVIATRKTPCGQGSKTWSHLSMNIHKRLIDLKASSDMVKQVTSIALMTGVIVEVAIIS